MGMTNLQQALGWIRAADPTARLVGDGSVVATRVHTDTRSVQPSDLFSIRYLTTSKNPFLAAESIAFVLQTFSSCGL